MLGNNYRNNVVRIKILDIKFFFNENFSSELWINLIRQATTRNFPSGKLGGAELAELGWKRQFFKLMINIKGSNYCEGEGWLGFPDFWSGQKPWWNWSSIPMVNFGEVRRAQLAKSTLFTSTYVLGIFSDLLRSTQMLTQREAIAPIHPW